VDASLVADAKQALLAFASKVEGASGIPFDVRIDHRVRGILAAAAEARADLIVLGAYGARAPEVGVGTAATTCVRHAAGRVLIVRDTQRGAFKCIVACVDFSPTSLRALDQAARVAAQDGAALHVLHVFTPPWRELHYRAPTPQADPKFQEQYRAALERRLAAFAGELGRELSYLRPTLAVFEYSGHRSGIVEYASRVHADLIVLGTRGRTGLRDLLLGSTAEKALRESKCSVLAIKPEGVVNALLDDAGERPAMQVRPPA
jgi:nucleotide-binding universal stress UspA family protein